MVSSSNQLRLVLAPIEAGRLFSAHFLNDVLPTWTKFAEQRPTELFDELRALWQAESQSLASANEAQTEERFIRPVLKLLGFSYEVQADLPFDSRRRQPDYALYSSEEQRQAALRLEGAQKYGLAVAVADAKRFGRPLDGRMGGDDPVAQIINYIVITKCQWGILTNGRVWRLYAAAGDLLEGACFEVDLVDLLESGDLAAFRYFASFFRSVAFVPAETGQSFLDEALAESAANAVSVGSAIEQQVFSAVPLIAEGLLGTDARSGPALAAAFDNSLVLLYRLLFCLYAEARGLLPVQNPHYASYSLRRQKIALANDLTAGRAFSRQSDDLYNDLRALFRIVDKGDETLGVSEYNGGLFSAQRHPYFRGRSISDALLAPAVDRLYRVGSEFVDYRDLSVRHLGTIYERLLDYRLEEDVAGHLTLARGDGRHETGSYFTPELVVDRIVERTLEPLLRRKAAAVANAGLHGEDVLDAFLELKVLDPAMGSGHFLVGATAFIATYIATDPAYDGDLPLAEIQRMVAERCIYGVDLNPLAVELAQLSLWLVTARAGEPLTFLNNLRSGNSLVGARLTELISGEHTLFASQLAGVAQKVLDNVNRIAHLDSSQGATVHEKERLAVAAQALVEPLEAYASEAIARFFTDDPRAFHWELEYPEVFLAENGLPKAHAGFDAVVGNPPYVRIQDLGRDLANYCRAAYEDASGSFDTYIPFIEQSLRLLNDVGRLGFIVPNKLLKLDFATRLRNRFIEHGLVEEVVDFGAVQLFEGATNYTCLLVLDRSGVGLMRYRKVDDATAARALLDVESVPFEDYDTSSLGKGPWVLAAGDDAEVLRLARQSTVTLQEATEQIFQGLITSADGIFVLEDRGMRGGRRLLYSKAADAEVELEPDLLHPLASGAHVQSYSFAPLGQVLLFPYVKDAAGERKLMTPAELAALPLTAAYLESHETQLRGRENKKMDHDGWFGYVYPKNLAAHDRMKLGVPRLCERLRASADGEGGKYLDNVDVNGILVRPDGASLWLLNVLLNSRLVDFVFRRGSVPFRGNFYSANKQFIAPLPIRLPESSDVAHRLDLLGRTMHGLASAILTERDGFIRWLAQEASLPHSKLPGRARLSHPEELTPAEAITILRGNQLTRAKFESRGQQEGVAAQLTESAQRLEPLVTDLARLRDEADRDVLELYEIPSKLRQLVLDD